MKAVMAIITLYCSFAALILLFLTLRAELQCETELRQQSSISTTPALKIAKVNKNAKAAALGKAA